MAWQNKIHIYKYIYIYIYKSIYKFKQFLTKIIHAYRNKKKLTCRTNELKEHEFLMYILISKLRS